MKAFFVCRNCSESVLQEKTEEHYKNCLDNVKQKNKWGDLYFGTMDRDEQDICPILT